MQKKANKTKLKMPEHKLIRVKNGQKPINNKTDLKKSEKHARKEPQPSPKTQKNTTRKKPKKNKKTPQNNNQKPKKKHQKEAPPSPLKCLFSKGGEKREKRAEKEAQSAENQ
jgi:hypothetical protein